MRRQFPEGAQNTPSETMTPQGCALGEGWRARTHCSKKRKGYQNRAPCLLRAPGVFLDASEPRNLPF